MPYTDPPSSWDDTLLAQDAALQRRKALLTEQIKQQIAQQGYYKPYQPDNSEVGGFTLSTGQRIPGRIVNAPLGQVAQALTPLVAGARLDNQTQQFDTDQGVFNTRAREDAMRRLQAMPQGTPATSDTEGMGPTLTGAGPTIKGQPAQDAPLADTLRWAASLSDNPRTQALGTDILKNQLVTLPGKRADQILEYLKLVEQHRHNTAEEGKPISVPQIGMFIKDPTVDGGYRMVAQTPDKPLSEAPAKDWRETSVQIGQIDDALALLRSPAGRSATGLWQGAVNAIPGVGTQALNLFDPDGRATRALVSQIASAKIKNTSGTAVAASEEARLRPWIPQVGDENDTVILKLEGFRREYAKMLDEIAKQAKQQGQKSPTPPPTKPTEAPLGEDVATSLARVLKERGEPTISPDADMGTMQASIDRMTDPVERAMAQRALDRQKSAPKPIEVQPGKPMTGTPDSGPQVREAYGQQLMKEWTSARTDNEKALIEQRASSLGITFNGRPYKGGSFGNRSAWGGQ